MNVYKDDETVHIDLDHKAALILSAILAHVGGAPSTSPEQKLMSF